MKKLFLVSIITLLSTILFAENPLGSKTKNQNQKNSQILGIGLVRFTGCGSISTVGNTQLTITCVGSAGKCAELYPKNGKYYLDYYGGCSGILSRTFEIIEGSIVISGEEGELITIDAGIAGN